MKILNAFLCLNCLLTFRTFPLKIEIILCLKVLIPGIFSVSTHATCHENIRKIKILYFFISIWKSLIIRALKNGSTWNDSRSKMMMSNRPLFDHKLAKLSLSNSRMIVHFTQYCTLPPCIINSEQNSLENIWFPVHWHSKIIIFVEQKKSDLKLNTTLMNTVTKR